MPLSRRNILIAGATAPFVSSCATDLSGFSEESVDDLASRLGVHTASYVILNGGEPSAPRVVAGRVSERTASADPIFQVASLTKPVIAFAALKLARDGQLDLHAPVSRYLPDGYSHRRNPFGDPNRPRNDHVPASTLARIPVATLLNHSSGLPNWTNRALEPNFEPGERWQYSGEGYVLLQAVLSAIVEQDIEPFILANVFEPLDMRHSRLRLTDDIRGDLVRGGGRQFEFQEPNAAASMYTTARDYANFLTALLAEPTLLSLTLANLIPAAPELGLAWGRGWGVESAAGGPYIWQWGNNPGYRAFAMASVVSRNGFVLLTNGERGLALAAPLARATVPAEHRVLRFHMLG